MSACELLGRLPCRVISAYAFRLFYNQLGRPDWFLHFLFSLTKTAWGSSGSLIETFCSLISFFVSICTCECVKRDKNFSHLVPCSPAHIFFIHPGKRNIYALDWIWFFHPIIWNVSHCSVTLSFTWHLADKIGCSISLHYWNTPATFDNCSSQGINWWCTRHLIFRSRAESNRSHFSPQIFTLRKLSSIFVPEYRCSWDSITHGILNCGWCSRISSNQVKISDF